MWHILTHTTYTDNILKILKDGIIGAKHYNFKNKESIVYAFYLSSLLDNTKIKNWNFSIKDERIDINKYIIIGFNPHILNDKKFVICDRRRAGFCLKKKFKYNILINHNKSKPINFTDINNFINKRISITNDIKYPINIIRYEILSNLIKEIYFEHDNYSYIDNKFHNLNKIDDILNEINYINKLSDDDILDYYNKKNIVIEFNLPPQNDKYMSSHEVVIDGPIKTKDINFIMISKKANNEFKNELKKVCPEHIKIIEIEPNDFTNYTKRIQKVLEKNSEQIELLS